MSKDKNKRVLGWEGAASFGEAFRNLFPRWYSAWEAYEPFLYELRVSYRIAHNDWLVVLKREHPEEGRQVLFSSAMDPIMAMYFIDDALVRGKWKEDRPWSGE
jgi:hypothetical protein